MNGSRIDIDRLYELYRLHVGQLKADIADVNHSLGSTDPGKTSLSLLDRSDFEALLMSREKDPEVIAMFIRRITRGHEHEFTDSRAA